MPHQDFDARAQEILSICRVVAGVRKIVAGCFHGSRVYGYAKQGDVNVLLVLSDFRLKLRSYRKQIKQAKVSILAVDKGVFERDVERGWLGEFVADKIALPYRPFVGKDYLWQKEVQMKKRIIQELLESLIFEYPELSHELIIKVEYFMYKAMERRARLFPLITYSYLNMLSNDTRTGNIQSVLRGYLQALEELAGEDKIVFSNAHVRIASTFIRTVKKKRLRIPAYVKSLQKAAFTYLASLFPTMIDTLLSEEELCMKARGDAEIQELRSQLEEPERHLSISTPLGMVPLSDETTIEEFVRKIIPDERLDVKTEKIGGVLNDVYHLKLGKDKRDHRIVAKKFRDWHGFKWFALALWAAGTKAFAVLGRARLEREYAINQLLSSQGFLVPEVLYVSPKEGLIFQEFIEGETLAHVVKRIVSSKNERTAAEENLIIEVGRKIAEAHGLGIVFGDCKPENIIVTNERELYFVDLEQASRDGNQAWDIAEFLYCSGHYVFPLSSTEGIESVARNLVQGYVEAGGEKEVIRSVGSPRYTKVFSLFTLPHVILAISNICRTVSEA